MFSNLGNHSLFKVNVEGVMVVFEMYWHRITMTNALNASFKWSFNGSF